ncbi:MAG: class I SAM-dependent methyltransferase [Desulfobacteraceae bacterium]|nr:class I SAM-dependent methyltransferase [Desulfobacteraceae bacterium]
MCNDYVSSHDFLLDVGIATGLGSHLFTKADLDVFGIDGSIEMLNICKSKNIAKKLKHFDLQTSPLPYSNLFFNHVISCGVYHFFNDLDSILKEISRLNLSNKIIPMQTIQSIQTEFFSIRGGRKTGCFFKQPSK